MAALEASMAKIAENIPPQALVLIETTVAPGTTEQVAYPIIKKIFERRGIAAEPLLAHSYERVMPGRNYVASIRDFWRVCSGINPAARERVVKFLSEVLNVAKYPLTVLDRPDRIGNGQDCGEQLSRHHPGVHGRMVALRRAQRRGPQEGDRCHQGPADALEHDVPRAGHRRLLPAQRRRAGHVGLQAYFRLGGRHLPHHAAWRWTSTTRAALHAPQLVRDALRNMGKPLAASDILLLGAAYREDVGDTRYSGSEVMVRKLTEMGANVKVHDPYLDHWWEFEAQDTYPHPGHSLSRFFHRQEPLKNLRIEKDIAGRPQGSGCRGLGRAARALPETGPGRGRSRAWANRAPS